MAVVALFVLLRGTGVAESSPSLRDLADRVGLIVGAAVSRAPLEQDAVYARLAGRHFHVLTPENALKWGTIEHQPGRRDRTDIESIARFAEQHSQQLRGHTLVWDLEIPSWVDTSQPETLEAALVAHLRTTLRENRGRVFAWDVVNEALSPDGSRKPTVFERQLGADHIAEAFRIAKAEDPAAKRFYNDYGVLFPGPRADGLLRLTAGLRQAGVPIDGVGLQSHLHLVPEGRPDWAGMRTHLRRLGEQGLEVHLTELDVRTASLAGGRTGRWLAQAHAVYEVVSACVDEPACTSVTFWGITDRHSWVNRDLEPDEPLLWDDQGAPKPAFAAVQDALMKRPWRGCREALVDEAFGEAQVEHSVTGGIWSLQEDSASADGHWLRVEARTESWHGPQLAVGDWLSEGLDYRWEARVRVDAGQPVRSTLRIEDGGGTRYHTLSDTVGTGAWQLIRVNGPVELQPPVRSVHWYVEGPAPGSSIGLDSVRLFVGCAEPFAATGAGRHSPTGLDGRASKRVPHVAD